MFPSSPSSPEIIYSLYHSSGNFTLSPARSTQISSPSETGQFLVGPVAGLRLILSLSGRSSQHPSSGAKCELRFQSGITLEISSCGPSLIVRGGCGKKSWHRPPKVLPLRERTRIVSPFGAWLGQAISILPSCPMHVSNLTDSEPSPFLMTFQISVFLETSIVSPAFRSAVTGIPETREITTLPSTGVFRLVSIVSIVTAGLELVAASEGESCAIGVIDECGSDDDGCLCSGDAVNRRGGELSPIASLLADTGTAHTAMKGAGGAVYHGNPLLNTDTNPRKANVNTSVRSQANTLPLALLSIKHTDTGKSSVISSRETY